MSDPLSNQCSNAEKQLNSEHGLWFWTKLYGARIDGSNLTLGRLQLWPSLSYRSLWCLMNFLVLFLTIFGLEAGVRAIFTLEQKARWFNNLQGEPLAHDYSRCDEMYDSVSVQNLVEESESHVVILLLGFLLLFLLLRGFWTIYWIYSSAAERDPSGQYKFRLPDPA